MVPVVIFVASAISVLLFLTSAWLTRAGYWRAAAALMGGLVATAFRFAADVAAFRFDWWSFDNEAHAPLITYAPLVFWFGGGLGLIGWRMIRNWGGAGEMAYFVLFVLLGLARDVLLVSGGGALVFEAGVLPMAIAAVGWLIMAFLVQLVMQILVGAVDVDALAPERIPQIEADVDADWPADSFGQGVGVGRWSETPPR